jgi:hypothetical protein
VSRTLGCNLSELLCETVAETSITRRYHDEWTLPLDLLLRKCNKFPDVFLENERFGQDDVERHFPA